MNGAYWQAFGLKTQARVVCHPLSRRAPLRMLEGGIFGHCLRGVRARSERPLDSDAPSPPAPFFAQPEGAGGIPSDGISKKAVLDGARWINGGPLMQVSLRVGRAASMRRVGSASGVAC